MSDIVEIPMWFYFICMVALGYSVTDLIRSIWRIVTGRTW